MGRYGDTELDDVELTGERLLLRRWRADDADRVREVMREASMHDFLAVPDPYDDVAATDFVTRTGHEGRGEGTGLGGAIVERVTGRVVGAASLRLSRDPEIGYWVAPDARGHGYATEAVRLLAGFGFGLGVSRIAVCCDVRNVASARTALRAGFRYEGTQRDAAPAGALGRGDLACFGRLADDSGDPVPAAFATPPREGLRDGTVTLRPLRAEDAAELAETDDELTRRLGFGGPAPTQQDTARHAARAELDLLVGTRAVFAIVDDETGGLAGSLVLRLAGPPGVGGIGYVVHPLFRGRGYTTRALRLLVPWALAHGFARLELGAKVGNVASQRAALAAGFEPDGVRAARLRNPDGSYADEARFALLNPSGTAAAPPAPPDAAAQPE